MRSLRRGQEGVPIWEVLRKRLHSTGQAPASAAGLEEAGCGEEHNMKERDAALDATFEVIMRMSLYDDEDECELSAEEATVAGNGCVRKHEAFG